jgi:AcrR family transcriptional regulator
MPATKNQIADTFLRHVERFGYGKASVEDVAAELGISKRTIYQHFSGKQDLYAYVVGRIAEAQRVQLSDAIADVPGWAPKMERFLTLVVGGMRRHIQETSKADWMQEFEVAVDAMAGAYGAIATELIRSGFEAGEFEFADAHLANDLIGAMLTHYGVLVREDNDYDADEALVAAIMRMLGARGADRGRRG